LLFYLITWATRNTGQFDFEPRSFLIAVVGGSTILALPLWILGELPVQAGAGPGAKAWFFGLMAGAFLIALLRWLDGPRSPKNNEPATPPGRCPYCGHFPGFLAVLTVPPTRTFECGRCRRRVKADPGRAAIGIGLVFVPLAAYVVGWGPPEEIPEWTAWVLPVLVAFPYPFLARIVPAEEAI